MIVHVELKIENIDGPKCEKDIVLRSLSEEFFGFEFDVDDSVYSVTDIDYVNQPD